MNEHLANIRTVLESAAARVKSLEVMPLSPDSILDGLHSDLANLEVLAERMAQETSDKTYRLLLEMLDDEHAGLRLWSDENAAVSLRLPRAEWEALGRPGCLDVGVKVRRG